MSEFRALAALGLVDTFERVAPPTDTARVDCDAGRRLGCASYCCRLIVRLAPGERDPGNPSKGAGRCVDKDPADGLCVYYDKGDHRCTVYTDRPSACRQFDCNADPLLEPILRDGFRGIVPASLAATRGGPRKFRVPLLDDD